MPMDPVVGDALMAQLLSDHNANSGLTRMADRNLTQAGGIINLTLLQQHGGTADDAALFSALRTSIFVPQAEKAGG